jgi:DNA-binding cell septation regulator SpoVG
MITVERIKLMSTGNLRAFVSIKISNGASSITIHDCRIVQQPGQAAWVALPQREYTDRDGAKKWTALVWIEGPLKDQIDAAVIPHYEEELRKQPPPPAPAQAPAQTGLPPDDEIPF